MFSLPAGQKIAVGALSPALLIAEAGSHEATLTREVKIKQENKPEPSLEVVENGEEPATFFGIPIGGSPGSGGSSGSSGSSGKGTAKSSGKSEPQYKTVTEKKTFPKYRAEVSAKKTGGTIPDLSQDLFLTQLKNGEIFQVNRPEQRRCQICRGFKRVTSDRPVGKRAPDGKMPCPACRGAGEVGWNVTYRVVW